MSAPKAIIGVPLFNHADHLPEALESLLSQTYRDFRLVLCDDCSTDATPEIALRYAERDERILYHRNPSRIGMTRNWRLAFDLGRRHFPGAEYFAWGSDHDAWHPRWLQALVEVLDAEPDVVLAYPLNLRVSDAGQPVMTPWSFDTAGLHTVAERLPVACRGMVAGDMVYGLYRADVLARTGVFRSVLLPDRLMLSELSIYGRFVQVPEILWERRFHGLASLERQRRAFFPQGPPAYSYLPWWLIHPAVMAWNLVVLGRGAPSVGRMRGVGIAALFLRTSVRFELQRKILRAVKKFDKRTRKRRKRLRKQAEPVLAPIARIAHRLLDARARVHEVLRRSPLAEDADRRVAELPAGSA